MENPLTLRPMSVTELIDATFSLYRRNFVLFAGVVAVLQIPETILSLLLPSVSTASYIGSSGSTTTFNGTALQTSVTHTGVVGLLSFLFGILITGALAFAISRRYLGEPVTVMDAYRGVKTRGFLSLLGADLLSVVTIVLSLVMAAGVVAGIAALIQVVTGLTAITVLWSIVGGLSILVLVVWLWTHFLFIAQAIVLDGTGPVAAFRRSWVLVAGSFWRVLGTAFLLYLITAITSGVISGIADSVLLLGTGEVGRLLVGALGGVVSIVVQPFTLTGLTLLYNDQRLRREGFDREDLRQQTGMPTST